MDRRSAIRLAAHSAAALTAARAADGIAFHSDPLPTRSPMLPPVLSPDQRLVSVGGLQMAVRERGTGPAVLLCHGFPETSYAWRHQLAALAAAGYRAIAPDLRGYGGTEAPPQADQYTTFHAVGDLVGLLDALEVPTAVVVGNDWGATVAWQAALLRPDRFRAVVALGVPLMGPPPVPPSRVFPRSDDALFYTLYFQEPGVAEREFERDVRTTLRKILYTASADAGPRRPGDGTPNPFGMVSRQAGLLAPLPLPPRPPAWLTEGDLDVYVRAYEASGFRGGLNYYRNLDRNWELQRGFARRPVPVPALYLSGDRDPGRAIPGMDRLVADMGRLAPHVRPPVTLHDCGHWAPQEQPDAINAALLAFLRTA